MKTYKINNVEVSEAEIRNIIRNNPEILEEKEFKYFTPKDGEKAYWIDFDGDIMSNTFNDDILTSKLIQMGVYKTQEQAELELEKRKAIVRIWNWADEHAPFVPDWGDDNQDKYFIYYDGFYKNLSTERRYCNKHQFTLPYFKSEQDAQACIEAYKKDLLLLFTK